MKGNNCVKHITNKGQLIQKCLLSRGTTAAWLWFCAIKVQYWIFFLQSVSYISYQHLYVCVIQYIYIPVCVCVTWCSCFTHISFYCVSVDSDFVFCFLEIFDIYESTLIVWLPIFCFHLLLLHPVFYCKQIKLHLSDLKADGHCWHDGLQKAHEHCWHDWLQKAHEHCWHDGLQKAHEHCWHDWLQNWLDNLGNILLKH